jgi:hypothetical protein
MEEKKGKRLRHNESHNELEFERKENKDFNEAVKVF